MADARQILEIIGAMEKTIGAQKEYLTQLDQPIGDSDHGINLDRGFKAVGQKLSGMEGKDIGSVLKDVGMTLVSTVGGASGPLYGSAFMKAGAAAAGKTEIDADDFLAMLEAAVEAVKKRGRAQVEEATMLDAMCPSLEAMKRARAGGEGAKAMLEAGVKAAWAGAEHTKDLVATKGRASYVGERGLGHQDPGATSYSYLLETIAHCIQ
ncbi:MAG: dihydroxyacetone kinase subunit L [Enterocloster asparagiformis]|nr:dihydroxyacetone kinase subunit L [Enterocloster asparagiformis]